MKLFQDIKKIHFIGIGGIGISAIAKLALKDKKIVSGSDISASEITRELEKMDAKIFKGHQKENLAPDTDLVIYSPAVPEENPERQKAFQLKIPQLNYPQILSKLSNDKQTIAVSGTNGKSTTTALLGLILERAGLDPTVIVGSKVVPSSAKSHLEQNYVAREQHDEAEEFCHKTTHWYGNLRLGKSDYFVVEACEWQANMLNLNPSAIVLTNIEEDHLDYYRDLNHIIKIFQEYIDKLNFQSKQFHDNKLLILNADDLISQKLKLPNCQIITYGIKNKADLMAKKIKVKDEKQYFELHKSTQKRIQKNTENLGQFTLSTPGQFNIYNALAATACALALGVTPEAIKDVLTNFHGLWRRFEKVTPREAKGRPEQSEGSHGQTKMRHKDVVVISDYAHHPTAIRETIRAAREFYPARRIIAAFQPHHHNRTKKLFKDFIKSFDQTDLIILNEIFEVAGREDKDDRDVSSKDLVKAIKKRCPEKKIFYGKNLEETKKLILENLESNDLLLIMGAGDIYKISDKILVKG